MKRAFLLTLALALCLALAACGKQTENTGKVQSGAESAALSAQTVESTPTQNAQESAVSDTTAEFLRTITAETAKFKGVCGADLTWYYQDNVLVIKGTGPMNDYDHNWVTEAPWGEGRDDKLYEQIHWVVFDDGVTYVGKNAFYEMKNLSRVEFADSITDIGNGAFYGTAINSAKMPKSLKTIQEQAFFYEKFSKY